MRIVSQFALAATEKKAAIGEATLMHQAIEQLGEAVRLSQDTPIVEQLIQRMRRGRIVDGGDVAILQGEERRHPGTAAMRAIVEILKGAKNVEDIHCFGGLK